MLILNKYKRRIILEIIKQEETKERLIEIKARNSINLNNMTQTSSEIFYCERMIQLLKSLL